MKIGYFQFDVQFGKKEANLEKVREVLSGSCPDLLVLPELYPTVISIYTTKYRIPVLSANRIGHDLFASCEIVPYCGGSHFLDHTGTARTLAGEEEIIRCMEFNSEIVKDGIISYR